MQVRGQPEWVPGTVVRLRHTSNVLQDNPWQDPVERDLHVYLPPGYRDQGDAYASLWDLAAFTNAGPGHLNWKNHGENLPARLDRLIGQGVLPPVVVVIPDCYTSLGGNQYVNSAGVGRYADYLVEELVPFVSAEFNVINHHDGRGLFGKSSGGYGALYHAMHYPQVWGAVASHAGDVGFDLVYRSAFPAACAGLSACGGDPAVFLRNFWACAQPSGPDFTTLMVLAMAASYDPDPDRPGDIRLPFDLKTCTVDPARWARWRAFDPLEMVHHLSSSLQAMRLVYLDVGTRDQYHIQYGTRSLVKSLEYYGVEFHYEEFDGTHSGMDARLDRSLPLLAHALKNAR